MSFVVFVLQVQAVSDEGTSDSVPGTVTLEPGGKFSMALENPDQPPYQIMQSMFQSLGKGPF